MKGRVYGEFLFTLPPGVLLQFGPNVARVALISQKGQWHYLYRAVDKAGKTIDFFLSPTRDELTSRRFLQSAVLYYGAPRVVTVDGYCGNHIASEMLNWRRRRHGLSAFQVRSSRYL